MKKSPQFNSNNLHAGSFELGQIDSAAIESLFKQHQEELLRFLTGLLGDSNSAADALQSTFAKLIETGSELDSSNIRAWLFKVGYNQAMEFRRRKGTTRRVLQNLLETKVSAEDQDLAETHSESHDFENRESVKAALSLLSPEQLRIVQKRIYEDKKFSQIAEELELPLGTVLTRMRSAMKKLAKEITRNDFDDK